MDFFRKALWGSDDDEHKDGEGKEKKEKKERGKKEKDKAKEKDKDGEVQAPPQAPPEGSVGQLLWSILSSRMGSDVVSSGISLPAWMYEPLTILQRAAETLEHHKLLAEAAGQKDAASRLAYVAAFAVSAYASTTDARTKTNFNPILGETFEFVDEQAGIKFFGEQVSHHPPISAIHAVGPGSPPVWVMWQNSSPTTKFLGNSLDVNTRGRSHIYFPAHSEHVAFANPITRVHNIILGSFWYEHYGELHFTNAQANVTCTVTFKKAGLFQGAQHDVDGYVKDDKGTKLIKISGAWNSHVKLEWLVDTAEASKGEKREVLRASPTWVPPYSMPAFAARLNALDQRMRHYLLPSDSRRRPDRAHLERGDVDQATQWKVRLEEQQRQERKARDEANPWRPLYFRRVDECTAEEKARWLVPPEAHNEGDLFVYVGDYWEQREAALRALEEDTRRAQSSTVTQRDYYAPDAAADAPLRPLQIRGTAADFLRCQLEDLAKDNKEKGDEDKETEEAEGVEEEREKTEETETSTKKSSLSLSHSHSEASEHSAATAPTKAKSKKKKTPAATNASEETSASHSRSNSNLSSSSKGKKK